MNLRLTVYQMLNIAGEIFKIVLPGGEILLGRVVTAGFVGGDLSSGSFRLYRDFAQFSEGEDVHLNKEIIIADGGFIVVQRLNRHNFGQRSTYELILQLNADIQAFKDDYHDYGIIIHNLPDKLEQLKAAFKVYEEEQQTINAALVDEYLDAHIRECRNCPPFFKGDLEEDKVYKVKTVQQAKYYANEAVRVGLGPYMPSDRRPDSRQQ